jgi:hypothetical protein
MTATNAWSLTAFLSLTTSRLYIDAPHCLFSLPSKKFASQAGAQKQTTKPLGALELCIRHHDFVIAEALKP